MDWQQKAEALAALADLSIKFREREWRVGGPDPWYVSQNVEVKDGSILSSVCGNGHTPEEAIEDHWKQLVDDLTSRQYLIINVGTKDRRAVKWNGFMWQHVDERVAA